MRSTPLDLHPDSGRQGVFYYRDAGRPAPQNLCIEGLGIREHMTPSRIRHGGHGYPYLLMHFHTPVQIEVGTTLIDLPKGTVIWPPGALHHYGNSDQPWTHSWLVIGGTAVHATMTRILTPLGLVAGQPLPCDDAELFSRFLQLMYVEVHQYVEPDSEILEGIWNLWLLELARLIRPTASRPVLPKGLQAARAFLEANLHSTIRLPQLAATAKLSVSRLSALFQQHFGLPPLHYQQRLRMKRANMLLQDDNLSVATVAQRCGYDDPLYFSKVFRRWYGQSPSAFRQRVKNLPVTGPGNRGT